MSADESQERQMDETFGSSPKPKQPPNSPVNPPIYVTSPNGPLKLKPMPPDFLDVVSNSGQSVTPQNPFVFPVFFASPHIPMSFIKSTEWLNDFRIPFASKRTWMVRDHSKHGNGESDDVLNGIPENQQRILRMRLRWNQHSEESKESIAKTIGLSLTEIEDFFENHDVRKELDYY